MKKIVAATVTVLVTASGCSAVGGLTSALSTGTPSPSFTPQEQAAITALTTAFSSGKLVLKTDTKSADCIATGLVGKLGTDKLVKYKIIRADMTATRKGLGAVAMSQGDATVSADVVLGCVDPLTAVRKITKGTGLRKNQSRCLSNKLTADALKLMFVDYLDQQPSLDPTVMKPLRQCTKK